MIVSGFSFASDASLLNSAPTDETIKIQALNAEFDDLYGTINYNYDTSDGVTWDDDTILYAPFDSDYGASNGFDTSEVAMLRLRRRESANDPWLTVLQRPIVNASDYNIDYYDRYARAGKSYQYIIVPVNSSGTEGEYIAENMSKYEKCEFDGIAICDVAENWITRLNCSYTKQRNIQTNTVTTLASKYPYQIQNAYVNYWSGGVSGLFVSHTCKDIDFDGGNEYRNEFYDFLTNGMPKVLKTHDGEMWMVQISGNITEDDSYYKIPTTSFTWVQIGDAEDYDDLYYNGFIYSEDL